MIYLGFGTTAIIDITISAMICLVFYKYKLDNPHSSPQHNKLLTSLIKYIFATGLVTA